MEIASGGCAVCVREWTRNKQIGSLGIQRGESEVGGKMDIKKLLALRCILQTKQKKTNKIDEEKNLSFQTAFS